MSCVQDLSIGELALYANGAGNFAIECRAEIARRDSFWADSVRCNACGYVEEDHGKDWRTCKQYDPPEAAAPIAQRLDDRAPAARISGATLAQRLVEVERERDEAQANLSACRQERDHWLTVATQAQAERDATRAATAPTARPLPDRDAIAQSIYRGVYPTGAPPWPPPGGAPECWLRAADHVLELLRPYALAQPANELDYRVSAEELGERIARFVEVSGPITPWNGLARMVAGVLGVNLRKPDAAAEPAPPAEAADLPASLGTPAPTEPAPFTPTGELVALRAHVERLEQRLAKVEAVAHAPVPVAHADDVELIWTFISRVAELPAFRNTIEAASRAAQLALKHRQTHKVSSDR